MTQPRGRGSGPFRSGKVWAVIILVVGALLGSTIPADAALAATPSPVTAEHVAWAKAQGKGISITAADFPSGNVYCTPQYTKRKCLKPLTGWVDYLGCGAESGGGDVNTVIDNPNRVRAPRDIILFVDGHEFFGDRDWAQPGKSTVPYRGIPNGDYILLVGWDDQGLIFYGQRFTVNCA